MNSEREYRKELAEHLDGEIDALENSLAIQTRTLEAHRAARKALSEVPKKQTPCNFERERFTISGVMEKGRCSECLEDSVGWDSGWQHCPKCGSKIVEAKKESNPISRLQHDAVRRAVNQLTGAR
jgi:Zn finger protein HypA/HybF involved in hydrogenase expression